MITHIALITETTTNKLHFMNHNQHKQTSNSKIKNSTQLYNILKFTHKLPLQMTLGKGILGREIPKKYHKTFNCHCNSGNFYITKGC